MTRNTSGKCGDVAYFAKELAHAVAQAVDILVIHEPGLVKPVAHIIRKMAADAGGEALVRTEEAEQSGGTIVVLLGKWAMVKDYDYCGYASRVVQITFKAPQRRTLVNLDGTEQLLPLERMCLFTVYGYASKDGQTRVKNNAMWQAVKERKISYQKEHPLSTVIIAGDLNATVSTALDTDDEGVTSLAREEKDATVIRWALENLGV